MGNHQTQSSRENEMKNRFLLLKADSGIFFPQQNLENVTLKKIAFRYEKSEKPPL